MSDLSSSQGSEYHTAPGVGEQSPDQQSSTDGDSDGTKERFGFFDKITSDLQISKFMSESTENNMLNFILGKDLSSTQTKH